jgi:hypothetical protein
LPQDAFLLPGRNQIPRDGVALIAGGGMTLTASLVEGHSHRSFVDPPRNQELGEIPSEEHLLRTHRNAILILLDARTRRDDETGCSQNWRLLPVLRQAKVQSFWQT